MKEHVIIKGNRYGIVLVLDPDVPFEDLLIEIGVRFDDSSKYFNSNTQSAITFEGRDLSSEEIDRILDLIKKRTTLRIPYVIDNNNNIYEIKNIKTQNNSYISEIKVYKNNEQDSEYSNKKIIIKLGEDTNFTILFE